MTYLSVIAAASAAALLAGTVQADPQSGLPTGKRMHKPVVTAQKPADVAHGQSSGKRQHKPIVAKTVDQASPQLYSAALSGKRRHQPVAVQKPAPHP